MKIDKFVYYNKNKYFACWENMLIARNSLLSNSPKEFPNVGLVFRGFHFLRDYYCDGIEKVMKENSIHYNCYGKLFKYEEITFIRSLVQNEKIITMFTYSDELDVNIENVINLHLD